MSIETLERMSRVEKLKLMEMLWEQLSQPANNFESPPWHADELAATERRLQDGQEQIHDWAAAKEELRRQSK